MTADMEKTITISRVFNAPRPLVWRAWTEPEHLMRWWGPHHYTSPRCEVDVRPGGALRIDMQGPDGNVCPMKGSFTEVSPIDRLAFSAIAETPDGTPILEARTIVTFTDLGEKTELTVTQHALGLIDWAPMALAGMEMGWTQTLEKLAEALEKN